MTLSVTQLHHPASESAVSVLSFVCLASIFSSPCQTVSSRSRQASPKLLAGSYRTLSTQPPPKTSPSPSERTPKLASWCSHPSEYSLPQNGHVVGSSSTRWFGDFPALMASTLAEWLAPRDPSLPP